MQSTDWYCSPPQRQLPFYTSRHTLFHLVSAVEWEQVGNSPGYAINSPQNSFNFFLQHSDLCSEA